MVLLAVLLAGGLLLAGSNLAYFSLENALTNLFLHYEHCLLTIVCSTVAIFRTSEGKFKIFDPHSRDLYGMPHPCDKCVLVSVESMSDMVIYFQNTINQMDLLPFEIKGVSVYLKRTQNSGKTAFKKTALENFLRPSLSNARFCAKYCKPSYWLVQVT